jgi:two-component system osmolarity sensor histidine kinase EnvZ
VAEADREALFDRFVRGATARDTDREGLGLGLSITREVARRHGGECVLEESPLGGLRARLTLRAQHT